MRPLDTAREEFGALGDRIYLDICARSPLPKSVVQTMQTHFDVCMREGARKEEWLAHIELVRARMASLIGAGADEVAYTKSTSEGINVFAHGLGLSPGDNIVLAPEVEHPNNIYPWLNLRGQGIDVRLLSVSDGNLDPELVARAIDKRTRVVVVAHVSFKSGIRADLHALAEVAHAARALLFVDAAQSLGLLDVQVRAIGVDALAACVHKGLLAPYGLAIFYCHRELIPKIHPVYMARAGVDLVDPREFVVGDLHNVQLATTARRFEFGSYNFPAIYALGASLELLHRWRVPEIEHHVLSLSDRVREALTARRISVVGPTTEAHRSHIVCARHPEAEVLASQLDARGVRVSARLGVLRVAAGPYTTFEEVTRFLEILDDTVRYVAAGSHQSSPQEQV